jgi:DNA-binding response OmpR family regulator
VRLTPKDFELLRCLVLHACKAVTHREVLQGGLVGHRFVGE